jgi:hypothetical protein
MSFLPTLEPESTDLPSRSLQKINSLLYDGVGAINVKWYGAKGAGVTDDTAAIQAAIDASSVDGGGIVSVPPGTYLISSTIHLKPKVRLVGSGCAFDQGSFTYFGSTIFKHAAVAGFTMLDALGSNATSMAKFLDAATLDGTIVTSYCMGSSVEGISFDLVSATGNSSIGILLDSVAGVNIRDCAINRADNYAIRAFASSVLIIDHILIISSAGGMFLNKCGDSQIQNVCSGGVRGPALWLCGTNHTMVSNSLLFNSVLSTKRGTFTVDHTTNIFTKVGHGFITGDPVTFEIGTTLPTPLSVATTYFVSRIDDDTFTINTQYGQGIAGGALQGVAMDIGSAGTGSNTIGPGIDANVVITGDSNLFVGSRADQGQQHNIVISGGYGNVISGCSAFSAGWLTPANSAKANILLTHNTYDNTLVGIKLVKRGADYHSVVGIEVTTGCLHNSLVGISYNADLTSPLVLGTATHTRSGLALDEGIAITTGGDPDVPLNLIGLVGTDPRVTLDRTGLGSSSWTISQLTSGSAADMVLTPLNALGGFVARTTNALFDYINVLCCDVNGRVGIRDMAPATLVSVKTPVSATEETATFKGTHANTGIVKVTFGGETHNRTMEIRGGEINIANTNGGAAAPLVLNGVAAGADVTVCKESPATTAVAGFLSIPACSGTPTGVPTNSASGRALMVFDQTNNILYAYAGGAWRAC